MSPPASDAPPAGRSVGAERPRTDIVRITRPELARRAILKRTRSRLIVAASGFGVLFGAVAFGLADAMVLDPAEPRRLLAMAATQRPVDHQPERGPIIDRNGEILAVSLPVTALYVNQREIQDPAGTARRLARILPQLDEDRVAARLTGDRPFAYIARSVTPGNSRR